MRGRKPCPLAEGQREASGHGCRGPKSAITLAMILVFGSLNIDLVARVPVIPGPGRTVLAPSYETHFGGKGANEAVAAARIAGEGRVQMAGRVGRDRFGDE